MLTSPHQLQFVNMQAVTTNGGDQIDALCFHLRDHKGDYWQAVRLWRIREIKKFFRQVSSLEDLTDEIWDRTLNINLRGSFYCMRQAASALKKNPGSSIINVASIAPYVGGGSSIIYAASKAGMISMTKSFARILAPQVRVNAIAPGAVRTRFAGWPSEMFDNAARDSILERIATPEDVGKTALFLAAEAGATTGETIKVDCGLINLMKK